ncbi:MAG TPA: dihydroxyacetone kinase subunit L, partial [Planctomycetaceae bacterium]|nr:dihydroxyacetone kinase subunit L [Planctomycetaceae bacterium]
PAIEAMSRYRGKGASLAEIFDAAAGAAKTGADSTKDLIAKHGRAKNLGDRSRGHLDAGATSTALIYAAYASVMEQ